MKHISERSLTIRYTIALCLIALCTLGSHYALTQVVSESEGFASIINLSGRQRMLSQRVASFAAQYALGMPTAQADLIATSAQLDSEFRELLNHPLIRNQSDSTLKLAAYSQNSLATEIGIYVATAKRIAAMSRLNPLFDQELTSLADTARLPLLEKLEAIVAIHQENSERSMHTLRWLQHGMLFVVLVTLVLEAFTIFRPMVSNVTQYARRLMQLAYSDSLTGTLSRRAFLERANSEVAVSQRTKRPLSLFMLDIDRFKQVNDTHGHGGGDTALAALADITMRRVRSSDSVGRLGGDEFAILLPDTSLPAAHEIADEIRVAVDELVIHFAVREIRLSVSIGVAELGSRHTSIESLLQEADQAMYAAKAEGRDCVMDATEQDLNSELNPDLS